MIAREVYRTNLIYLSPTRNATYSNYIRGNFFFLGAEFLAFGN